MKRDPTWVEWVTDVKSCCFASRVAISLFCSFAFVSLASANCDFIASHKSFWIRLVDPVASYSSKPGTSLRAVLIQSPECNGSAIFPVGLQVDGKVISVRKVGLGLIHDTAKLEIQFDRLVTPVGLLSIASEVVEVDNARETVRHGIIHGIRSTDTPQGRITSGLRHLPTFDPYSDIGLMVYRAFSFLPEPEIYLPSGTDLRLQFTAPLYVGDQPELPRLPWQLSELERRDIELLLQGVPERTTTSSGQAADLVNLLLIGSQGQVEQSFVAAGWHPADRNSYHAFLKEFGAFLTMNNYSTMPVSQQLINGQAQDSSWQKSLNSYAKREHLRIWGQPHSVLGQQAWLGANTRETSAALSLRNHKFIHHIDPNLDEGVNMLVRDLVLSGCVEFVYLLPRPDLPRYMVNATGDAMRTDGLLTVVQLKDCNRPAVESASTVAIPIHPHSRVVRYFRNQVLLYKSDVIRGNIIYGAFDLCRMSIHSFRHRNGGPIEDDQHSTFVSAETLLPQISFAPLEELN
jgi:hypothetical protein